MASATGSDNQRPDLVVLVLPSGDCAQNPGYRYTSLINLTPIPRSE